MPTSSRDARNRLAVLFVLTILLLAVAPTAPEYRLNAIAAPHEPSQPSGIQLHPGIAATPGGTFQDFDQPNTGTPYSLGIHPPLPGITPAPLGGGPTGVGRLLRLAYGTPSVNHNSIAFDRTDSGAFNQVVADFDFRITPGNGRADGFGFALLNTLNYQASGVVAPPNVAEEPNFIASLGVGFDIYRSGDPPTELNDNHISIHFNGALVQEFDARPALDLAGAEWVHARIIIRPGGGFSDITLILTQCDRPPVTLIDQFKVAGLTPYEGRAYFAARSGGLRADHDIDNVHVQFLSLDQSAVAFRVGCTSVVETDGQLRVTIDRAGSAQGITTVLYETRDITATAGLDYTPTAGTLTFNAGESSKTLSVPILNDSSDEGDEIFQLTLRDPTGGVVGGPATAKLTIVDDEVARRAGHWSEAIPSQVVAIHSHVLPNGKILYWDRHDTVRVWDGNPRLWDPNSQTIEMAAMPTDPEYDIFCSGHSFLADGRLLVTGGHISMPPPFDGGVGDDEASIYDPLANSWERLPTMNAGRWYPSNVTLADGDVLVMGGTYLRSTPPVTIVLNMVPQVFDTATNTWRELTGAQHGGLPAFADYYPFLYTAPNGKVFSAGPQQVARYLDTSGAGTWTDVATSSLVYRDYGSSVMYDHGKVLIVGGNPRDNSATVLPSASAEVIDLNSSAPAWRSVAPMHSGRRHLNTTLLPDGKVLVTGGSSAPGFDEPAGAALHAELWDPTSEQWTLMAAQAHYRGYHSTAVLLPDGRVLVGGGGHPDPAIGAQYNFEIYSPPYLFNGPRPLISGAPRQVPYGRQFFMRTPDPAGITGVTWIRLPSVTHAFNQNQRINHLAFERTAGGLKITAPGDSNIAPPGHYMLFILNDKGVPSVAQVVQLVDTQELIAWAYLPHASR